PQSIEKVARHAMGYYCSALNLAKSGFKVPAPDVLLKDNDRIGPFRVLHTPGHTGGSICLYSQEDKVLFSGDTLFRHSYGRTDLGGSEEQIMKSLRRLLSLPEDTTVYPGHDEPTIISDEQRYFGF
ncbi:MAG: MBL fold metallo-hydrolase, partial [Spirochaetales bacterium]|nr:MBL fold metallo-hydrolase [Spirochaetales bacterium]